MTLVSAGQLKTSDLVLSALVRARFCELIPRRIPRTQSDLFLVGMLSMMDAILDIPMAEVLEKIAIDQDTNWAKAEASAATLRVSESEVGELWWQSMQWGRQVSAGK